MSYSHRAVTPGYRIGTVISEDDEVLVPPSDWSFLKAGDAAVTRAVKLKGETWVVQVKKGRRIISKGIWASTRDIEESQKEVHQKRSNPDYTRKRERYLARKQEQHQSYTDDFYQQVVRFLNFDSRYSQEAEYLATLVTKHATPVGSGTVARTTRIPIEKRAEAAVIAWLRHQTTGYDSMKIARIKGKRREVRRQLACQSLALLEQYRNGQVINTGCPLKKAIDTAEESSEP